MYPYTADAATLPWTELDLPGVSLKILHKDETSGAMSVITRMVTGATIPAHSHTKADETVYVLEGDFVEDDVRYEAGTVFFSPANIVHGAHRTVNGCLLLTHFTAELDFVNPAGQS